MPARTFSSWVPIIRLVHAWQPPVKGRAHEKQETDAANRRLREQEERQLRTVVQQVAPAVSVPIEIIDDEPYPALRNRIAAFGADLLAMGTHARSRLSTAVVGSLAQEFLAAGPTDVLVARGEHLLVAGGQLATGDHASERRGC